NTLVAVGVVPREVAGSGRTVQELVNRCMEVVAPLVGHVELDGDGTADLHRYFTLRKPSLSRYRSGVGRQEQRDRRLWSSTGQLTRFLPRLKSWAFSLNLCEIVGRCIGSRTAMVDCTLGRTRRSIPRTEIDDEHAKQCDSTRSNHCANDGMKNTCGPVVYRRLVHLRCAVYRVRPRYRREVWRE